MHYLQRLILAHQQGHIDLLSGTLDVDVKHDDWCPVLTNKLGGSCECVPDIIIRGKGRIDRNGKYEPFNA